MRARNLTQPWPALARPPAPAVLCCRVCRCPAVGPRPWCTARNLTLAGGGARRARAPRTGAPPRCASCARTSNRRPPQMRTSSRVWFKLAAMPPSTMKASSAETCSSPSARHTSTTASRCRYSPTTNSNGCTFTASVLPRLGACWRWWCLCTSLYTLLSGEGREERGNETHADDATPPIRVCVRVRRALRAFGGAAPGGMLSRRSHTSGRAAAAPPPCSTRSPEQGT